MQRSDLKMVCHTAAKETLRTLAPCFVGVGTVERFRDRIKSVRDRLHEACCIFENGDACEEHEDLYLPLFDALSYITTASGLKPIPLKPINRCRANLEALELATRTY